MIGLALAALLGVAGPSPAAEATVPLNAGADVPAPTVLTKVDPIYPPEALREGVSGTVIVELIIDLEGHVASAELVRSIPPLDEAALAAVRQWTFEVTRRDGQPVRVRHLVPLSFAVRAPAAEAETGTTAGVPPTDVIKAPPASPAAPPPPPSPIEPGHSSVNGVTLMPGVPDLLSGRRPVVPPLARMQGASGSVIVRFSVDSGGQPTVHEVEGPDLLKPQADQAVRTWSFRRESAERVFLVATFTYAGGGASAAVTRRD